MDTNQKDVFLNEDGSEKEKTPIEGGKEERMEIRRGSEERYE